MMYFGLFGVNSDYVFGFSFFSGLATLIFSPVYLFLFIRKETGKIVVNQYEAVSITLGAVAVAFALVGLLMGIAMGEGMSNIH